ncbi:2-oxoglutarate dehydrogenase E1 component [Magnetospirillum gryphiswaldense]|uniref:2-oxoglutarate dehydrogenase E1 component n=1 Tax=Magnetospirillum gryphiswaldense (strain DSM 6361 / JCM 21280 / NBRC 15271 / MSR-1) TaxID=431944 RepID=V6F8B9_MAGGM|nr:2-oxoglutarate dehydrogenase E1 component [Magnetospirillum gryphiswaldense]AVM75206.1 2-oxoglutarate dehydrogenase E1 component [Magnetospirillum gryphiswaldense MSR-1]AVM79109.1 2-oxoglutarate dehydrogenase E1 component [Magnetospirillum gryphiswaldense]CDL00818.1 2-oxoglutarate decarboxylase, component of the 2-oxoglutarate dehydrogenase complex, thiamin-binding [Magnetospirillum gryphiswaldense MSR-1 v2]
MTNQFDETSFLTGGNAVFIAELYARYVEDPSSVDASWVQFFTELRDEGAAIAQDFKGTAGAKRDLKIIGAVDPEAAAAAAAAAKKGGKDAKAAAPAVDPAASRQAVLDSIRALMMIRTYRVRGHLEADLDPLHLAKREPHPELDYRTYGFTDADLDREIFIDNVLGLESATLRQIINVVRATYCGKIGVEFMHIQDPDQKAWIQKRVESVRNHTDFTPRGKRAILERLVEAEGFERFLQLKYTGTKRFGVEGGESVIPALEQIVKRGGQLGVEEVVVGMAHRGRLNVLANFMKKPYQVIFSEFQGGTANPSDVQGSGDVKYHLGTSADRDFDGNVVHLTLQPNPSHLEVANPVVIGRVRAKQQQKNDAERKKVVGILLHGDAAFAGQGVVPETMLLSQLKGYCTGGTIHIIINNQIGFTTAPEYSRSGPYSSDVAKGFQCPVLHVNADDPEAVVHVARIATEYRQEFGADVVIDMICYRRHGHNESDEPAFTQPLMYRKIASHPTTRAIYAQQLVAEGSMSQEEADGLVTAFQEMLEREFDAAKSFKPNKADWLEGKWQGLAQLADEEEFREEKTGVAIDTLKDVGMKLAQVPADFNINRKILRQMQAKAEMMQTGQGIDWATAEALAFGTLLTEGHGVRLSGQDCGRGTFSQRHCRLTDQENESRYEPLNHIREGNQAYFEVIDSPLSEEAVLGFEYGYSLAEPNTLTLWEGQFGDFANGAQVIIDQFINSGESKWLRMSGLVMLLPHGYEGQGPEHSSARWERYLQLSAEDNWQVCNLTTPGNYFHALRRQLQRNFRKPLIIMTPKSLLRHKLCVSPLEDMALGSRFRRVLPEAENLVADAKIRRVVVCSGKVYYDLLEERTKRDIKDVAIIRVEQLYPWPKDTLKAQLARYPNADLVWAQEEPANMGPWTFVDRRLEFICDELPDNKAKQAHYVGRKAAASPATGLYKTHNAEQAWICETALTGKPADMPVPFRRATALSRLNA